jgi:nucleoside-diphosphate-sugar epimerase
MSENVVLITGAAGRIGSNLREFWGDRYRLRLADINPIKEKRDHEDVVEIDITDYQSFLNACEGVETVIHLAADPSMQAEFYKTLLNLNVIGCYNAFEAARVAGCKRIIFASSINAVLGHEDKTPVKWDAPVYPINVYGATKCWGEALGRSYAHQFDLSCICVRIGAAAFVQSGEWDAESVNMGFSARDQAHLFGCCVDAPKNISFKIVNGVSKHRNSWMDLTCANELGYQPQDGTAYPSI